MVDTTFTTNPDFSITQATAGPEIDLAHSLFEEYAAGVGISLCFQNFDQELAKLPGDYAPPSGRLLLVRYGEEVAGCVALRRLSDEVCEMKRLYVRPEFRGKGLGRKTVDAIIAEAKQIGYSRMKLDTLPGKMDDAIALYRLLGFTEVAAYYDNPVAGALFMERNLD